MAGTIVADNVNAAATSTLILKNGVASAPPQFQDSSGTQIGTLCRAWVNFNGTGTVDIYASFNVSSITDNGTGDYTINMTTAMPDANYSWCGVTSLTAGMIILHGGGYTRTTSTLRIITQSYTTTITDPTVVSVSVFR